MYEENGQARWHKDHWNVFPDSEPNFEHIETINGRNVKSVPVTVEFSDHRKARPKQRALFFALMGDIHEWSGEPTEWLKEYFYTMYTIKTAGKTISLADDTENSVTDAKELIEQVIDFIFENGVPVKTGYHLLPRDENYFQYECIKHRECLICGKRGDIHHIEGIYGNTIGMGSNRNHVDHSKRILACLCRTHHNEIHNKGTRLFCYDHHLTNIGIKVDTETLKRIGVQGNYGATKDV